MLIAAGATQLREPDAPSHGGFRGYVADPDGHAWEIAWNPGWPIDSEGRKHRVGSALHDAEGNLVAAATATWITLKEA